MGRLIKMLPESELPSEEDRTERLSPNVRKIEPLEGHVLREYAERINDARETELLCKYSGMVTGIDLGQFMQTQVPQLWEGYMQAARYARHHVAHGKVLGRRAHMGKSYRELTEIMLQAFATLHFLFYEDKYFEHVLIGGPLPLFHKCSYDPSTRRITFSEDPSLILPEYRERGE